MTIQQQIDALKKEFETKIAELEKQAKAEEQKQNGVRKPKWGERYYVITPAGKLVDHSWTSVEVDEQLYIRGSIDFTKEEAEWRDQHRIVETELKRFVQDNDPNPITEEDWENCHKAKVFICYDYGRDMICFNNSDASIFSNQVYASDATILQQAIRHIGEERLKKYYFGVGI